jgi:hypothetical protein
MTSRGERWFVAVVFGVYAAATLIVALHHEPWRDEADPWLLIRDGGVSTVLARTGWVGMPALWYLAITPLVKLGLPYVSMTLLNLAFAWAAALLFLIAAPFPRVVRALFVCSFFMAYEYAVIARPYALGLLLLFAALMAWRRRATAPMAFAICVALLANTTPHMLLLAAVLGLIYVREHRAPLAIAVMLAGGLLSVAQLWVPADAPARHVVRFVAPGHAVGAFGDAFFPRMNVVYGPVLGAAIIAAVSLSIGRRFTPQLFLWCSLLGLSTIFVFIWMGGTRHSGLVLMSVIGALWLARDEGALRAEQEVMALLTVVLAIAVASGVWMAVQELRFPFSGSKEMAAYLRTAEIARRLPMAAHPPAMGEAVLPYLPGRSLYYAGTGREGTYMLWDALYSRAAELSTRLAAADARTHFGEQPFLLLVNRRLVDDRGYRLLHATERPFGYLDEQFFLYASEYTGAR